MNIIPYPRSTFFVGLALTALLLHPGLPALDAQEPLTLNQCIELAKRQNRRYLGQQTLLERSYARLEAAKAPFEIRADIISQIGYDDERDTFEDAALAARFREEKTDLNYLTSLNVTQAYSNIGELSIISRALRRDFISNRREDFQDFNGDLEFAFVHQVLNEPAIETTLKRAELEVTRNRYEFRDWQLKLEEQVTLVYYDLVQTIRQLEIQERRRVQAKEAVDIAERQFEMGLIAEVEALRLQVELLEAEAAYAAAEALIERRRDLLRVAMGLDFNQPLEVITDVDVNYKKYPVSMERAVAMGLRNRTDIKEAELQEAVSLLDLQEAQSSTGPNVQLTFNASLRGRGAEIGDVSSNFARNRLGGRMDIIFPLIDAGERRGRMRQAQSEAEQGRFLREERRLEVIRQIRDAVRNMRDVERQVDLRLKALEVATRTYEVEASRFDLGLAKSESLLNAQERLTNARTLALDAIISYRRSLKTLTVVTMSEMSDLLEEEAN